MKKSVKYLKILSNFIWFFIVLLLLIFVLPKLLIYFLPFVVGFILALIANPIVRFLESHIKIKRKHGTVLIIILVIGGLVLLGDVVLSLLWSGLHGFADYLPTMSKNIETELNSAIDSLQNALNGLPFISDLDFAKYKDLIQQAINGLVTDKGGGTANAIVEAAKKIPNTFVNVIMGLLATYFFIVDREKLLCLIKKHTPKELLKTAKNMYEQIILAVVGYFKAQFEIMFVIYIILVVGLMILDVNYAWLIGFGIAFLDVLPIFGTGTILIPWAVVKIFTGNYAVAIGMLALYGVCLSTHQILQPKLVGDSVGMDPFATLFFMYIGYKTGGVLGLIIAIPVGMILINMYKAGAFDTLIWCIKEIGKDFREFCKVK